MGTWDWMVKPKKENQPISDAVTAYTDAGKKSRTAAITWNENGIWKHKLLKAETNDSLQTMELLAVIWAVINLKGPLNVITDSLYVAGIVDRIEDAFIREIQNERLFELLTRLKRAVRLRQHPYANNSHTKPQVGNWLRRR